MKDNSGVMFDLFAPLLLILGDLGLFFNQTRFAGYIVLAVGCVFGLYNISKAHKFELSERFHLLTTILALAIMGFFIFTGPIESLVIVALILFVVNFMILIIDFKNNTNLSEEKESTKKETYSKYNEEKLYEEMESIRDELNHMEILEDGNIEDLSLRSQAEKIREEFKDAVVLQDPKEGRYFYKENGKMFHTKSCVSIQKTNKKELKSSNSRTELLAKGYKSCKVCNS